MLSGKNISFLYSDRHATCAPLSQPNSNTTAAWQGFESYLTTLAVCYARVSQCVQEGREGSECVPFPITTHYQVAELPWIPPILQSSVLSFVCQSRKEGTKEGRWVVRQLLALCSLLAGHDYYRSNLRYTIKNTEEIIAFSV